MKGILIDTHILIWWLIEPKKLKQKHLEIIQNEQSNIFVSLVSFWEISLKVKKGKLIFNDEFENILIENSFQLLPISLQHLKILQEIEYIHQDPFDMLILAQAINDNLELISYDEKFEKVDNLRLI